MPSYWLCKTEPTVYSIADLRRDGVTGWECIRNYQARNFMRDSMSPGDRVLIYHSNADPTGVAGVAEVVGEARADPTQFDPKSEYHDPKSTRTAPRWMMRDLKFVECFSQVVALEELRTAAALQSIPMHLNRIAVVVEAALGDAQTFEIFLFGKILNIY